MQARAGDAQRLAIAWLQLDDEAATRQLWGDANTTTVLLYAMCDADAPAAKRLTQLAPEVVRLAAVLPAMVEHDAPIAEVATRPLFDHSVHRALGTWLGALAADQRRQYAALTDVQWQNLRARWHRIEAAGLAATVRFALVHLDCSKGGAVPSDIDTSVHNIASATLVERCWADTANTAPGLVQNVALALIANHGLVGQTIRGETPMPMLQDLRARLADAAASAALPFNFVVDALAVINICDTAAVRHDLMTSALFAQFENLHTVIIDDDRTVAPPSLLHRLQALRASRLSHGEALADIETSCLRLLGADATATSAFTNAFAQCQLWYCEAALAELTPAAHLTLLAAAVGVAHVAGIDTTRSWHVNFARLVAPLNGSLPRARYRLRLLETSLARCTLGDALAGTASLTPLGALAGTIGGQQALWFELDDGEEGGALLTLLAIYERKSSTAFHSTLKALCDLYGLRKDQFDRVANEANYLATMNAARTDKERMLDYVKPGTIIEVGPGGGIVLDLLETRLPTSNVVGLDISSEVIAALTVRKNREHKRWTLISGDAFALPTLVTPGTVDTVIYCSILHEIYSYIERPGDNDPKPRRFRLESVRDLLRATWGTLRLGGRIVIRDGVMPTPGIRRMRFIAADARSFFDQFVAQFEGRQIKFTESGDAMVELTTSDAMEFLYTYTWGPASFPYEVREQYGVLPYDEYIATIVAWLGGPAQASIVDIPLPQRSYLQPGYQAGLAGKIELLDGRGQPVALPDSNCLIVIEKCG
ncbi:MAG: methyltransferase [Kofleriaceae bacterium]|nr:methyltransferase [Kofleriaceae bacterium]